MLFFSGKNLNVRNTHTVIINLLSCLLLHWVDNVFSIKLHLAAWNNNSISRSYCSDDLYLCEPMFLSRWIWNTNMWHDMINFCIALCVFGISELYDRVLKWCNGHLETFEDIEVITKMDQISGIRLPVLGSSFTTCINLQCWKASVN